MFEEVNTKTNLPAQIDIYAEGEDAYKFLFIAKGGGSANKTYLFQGTPSLLTHDRLVEFLREKILTLGTAACPPYHLAIVIGGTSAELNLKTVKLASTHYLDNLPTEGGEDGHAFRDLAMEAEILALTQASGVGAQFGGKYFCHDVRVIRLPRHGASLPIGLGVSVLGRSAGARQDQQARRFSGGAGARSRAKFLPPVDEAALGGAVVKIDLDEPMPEILGELTKYPIKTRLSLTGPMIVARDLAHAKIAREAGARRADAGLFQEPPGLLRRAGQDAARVRRPARSGRRRRDAWTPMSTQFQAAGGSMVMLAKGNRSPQVREACRKHGGFYLGSIGGAGGAAGAGLHQEGRGSGISRTRHGSGLAHRGRGFPRLHRRRRQGQRFLQGAEFGVIFYNYLY